MNKTFGDYDIVRPQQYGIFKMPEPMNVLVAWDGGEMTVFNRVTRAYVTERGTLTLMGEHGKAVGRVALAGFTRTHKRRGKVIQTLSLAGVQRETALTYGLRGQTF